ncbi:MAG TPA: hypothetical protein VMT24_19535, partial [Aggregatilineaceae bacterium]|nr:hypothetical protein [Aggregatilineaceae bacterium]
MTVVKGFLVPDDSDWRVPAYARDMLWVQVGSRAIQASGPRGTFELSLTGETDEPLSLTWGTADGPPLATWRGPGSDEPFVAGWQGVVAIGGFVERLHALERRGLELVVAEIEGALLPPDYLRLPTL